MMYIHTCVYHTVPRNVIGGVVVYPSEKELEIFGFDVQPDVLEKVPELRLAKEALSFRVVLVEDRLENKRKKKR